MPKSEPNSNDKVRVSLDLTIPFFQRLVELERVTHESKAGVIRHAIQFYEYIVEKTMEGYTFKAVDRNGREKDLVFFGPHIPTSKKAETTENSRTPEVIEDEALV